MFLLPFPKSLIFIRCSEKDETNQTISEKYVLKENCIGSHNNFIF